MEARAFRNAVLVLMGQQASAQRAPRRDAVVSVLEGWPVLSLDSLAFEHVVLRLVHDRRMQSVLVSDLASAFDQSGRPHGRAPVVDESLVNEPAERTYCLLEWCSRVRSCCQHNINVVHLKPLERVFHALDDVFARQAVIVWTLTELEQLVNHHVILPGHS